MNVDHWIDAVLALRKAKKVALFTGAGISAESGIPTFRDVDGFWKRFPIEEFAEWGGLVKTAISRPRDVAEFVLNVIEPIAAALPNPAHAAAVELAAHVHVEIITQNIDGLHTDAGSQVIHEVHGSLMEVVDTSSGDLVKRFTREELRAISVSLRDYVEGRTNLFSLGWTLGRTYPFDWRGKHRPRVVLFGDSLAEPAWSDALAASAACDVMIGIGTSGAVAPASSLPARAQNHGATVITIDPRPASGLWLEGKAGEMLPKLVREAFP